MKNSLSSINTYQSKYEKRTRKQKPAAALSGTVNSFSAGSGGAVLFSGNCYPAFARPGWRFDPRKACVAAARQAGCPVSRLQAGLPCASCARETGFTLISRGRAEFGRRFTLCTIMRPHTGQAVAPLRRTQNLYGVSRSWNPPT